MQFDKERIFSFDPVPLGGRSYQIMAWETKKMHLERVGDYTVLDRDEDENLTRKKLMNFVALLNGSDDLLPLGHETGTRLLFRNIETDEAGHAVRLVFYTHDGNGVSRENALVTLDKTILAQISLNSEQTTRMQCTGLHVSDEAMHSQ